MHISVGILRGRCVLALPGIQPHLWDAKKLWPPSHPVASTAFAIANTNLTSKAPPFS